MELAIGSLGMMETTLEFMLVKIQLWCFTTHTSLSMIL